MANSNPFIFTTVKLFLGEFLNENLIIIDNPLAKYYLTMLRRRDTKPAVYRDYVKKIGYIIGYEVSRLLKWKPVFVETSVARTEGIVPGKQVYIIGVLGASIPLMHGIWEALPWAGLGIVAARRFKVENKVLVRLYYERVPQDLSEYTAIAVDPTLATGNTMIKVLEKLDELKCKDYLVATIIASKPGLENLWKRFPGVRVIALSVDPVLNQEFFIVPGIGDAGDRSLSSDEF
ncbi:uracil phosphoribosyltransferase [Thermosphaera aggregans DSM 11486]|jgi:uracil phosphoribosyltransferase|uniref:Uracil phosphoribosyltransferase n=1 Tax=Thermosphaera aggregans (strain DSM 11486 / M11TL) TaxID=633148 RepID=D5U0F5_THEAM|nr:uracil phosphoribosyltransferase [Thermosphaera aggregans DSM 11486]